MNDNNILNFDNNNDPYSPIIPATFSIEPTTKKIDLGQLKIDGTHQLEIHVNNNFDNKEKNYCITNLTFKQRYQTNATVVTTATVGMNVLVRLFGNDSITGSKANESGLPLMTLMIPASFVGAAFKGNWRDVSSRREQFYVLLCYVLLSASSDALSYLISNKESDDESPVIGQTTLVAVSTALGYLTKMAAGGTMGLPTFTQNVVATNLEGVDLSNRKKMCYALLAALSTVTAVSSHYLDSGSAAGVMIDSAFSQCFSKVGKTLLKVENSKGAKMKAAIGCTATAILVSVIVGAAFPLAGATTTLGQFGNIAFHFGGPASGIATLSLLTNLGCRAREGNKKTASTTAHTVKATPSLKKKIVNALAFTATSAAAATMHTVNTLFLSSSKVVALGTKLCQMGWTYHSTREMMKGLKDKQKLCVLGAELAVAAGIEAAATAICPTASTGSWNYPTATIVAAVGARFLGKMIRETLLPKAK